MKFKSTDETSDFLFFGIQNIFLTFKLCNKSVDAKIHNAFRTAYGVKGIENLKIVNFQKDKKKAHKSCSQSHLENEPHIKTIECQLIIGFESLAFSILFKRFYRKCQEFTVIVNKLRTTITLRTA